VNDTRLGPWPRALAGACLAAAMAGALTMVGGIPTGASALVLAPDPASASPASASPASASPAAVPGAPAGLTAAAGNGQVTLSWAAPASDGGSPVTGYQIYLATAPGGQEAAAIGTTEGTGGTVTGLRNGTTYYFRVTAVNAAGNRSPFPAQVSAEPAGPAGTVTASLTRLTARKQLIVVLAVITVVAATWAFALIARRRRRLRPPRRPPRRPARDQARSGQPMAVAPDVRAVPDTVPPDLLSVRDTGREPAHTIRVESDPGVTTVTIKEGRP
jgi:Fibronectin type III domain